MGQKDLAQKNLESYPDVFADTVNALLYEGTQILLPQNLQSAPTETLYRGKQKRLRNQFHDVSQYVMLDGKIRAQYTLENETRMDSKMVLRKAGYTGAVYREQYDKKIKRIYPVISLVLHWGKHKWKSSRNLKDLFQKYHAIDTTMEYIDDIRLHIFDMRFLAKEVRERFTSDMRIVVDYLAEGDQYQPTDQPILHLEAFLLMMRELSDDFRYEQIIAEYENNPTKEGEISMCPLLDKYEAKGIAKGEQRVNQLTSLLIKQSRWDDIEKMTNDREYQQMLFEQYGL